jgi:exosome complex component RRP4
MSIGDTLVSSVAGRVEKVNKLVSVRPLKSRYQGSRIPYLAYFKGDIGDVVIGRITEVGQSRWKADIASRQDAVLLLSSVTLPGGIQRRKSESDALQMEKFFTVGELFSVFLSFLLLTSRLKCSSSSTMVALPYTLVASNTAKYIYLILSKPKLRNGSLVIVPANLIKRSKSHFISLIYGVDLILGMNGFIWVSMHCEILPEHEFDPETLYSTQNKVLSFPFLLTPRKSHMQSEKL